MEQQQGHGRRVGEARSKTLVKYEGKDCRQFFYLWSKGEVSLCYIHKGRYVGDEVFIPGLELGHLHPQRFTFSEVR